MQLPPAALPQDTHLEAPSAPGESHRGEHTEMEMERAESSRGLTQAPGHLMVSVGEVPSESCPLSRRGTEALKIIAMKESRDWTQFGMVVTQK